MSVVKMQCPECAEDIEVRNGRFVQHGACPGWFVHVKLVDQVEDKLESRFTEPSDWCPYPERWHSRDADSTEIEVSKLIGAFVGALNPDFVLETGTAWGQTARQIGENLTHGHLYTLEPDPERAAASRALCDGLPVTVVEAESLAWTAPQTVNFGFAWFDSLAHLRVDEFLYYQDRLPKGTIVGFHDTAPHQGILRAKVLELESFGHLLPIELRTPRGCILAEVT